MRKLQGDWQVCSAGTWTAEGLPPVQDAIRGAHQIGLDLSAHVSKVISTRMMSAADLVLVMEHGHKEALQAEFPRSSHKVHLLSEAAIGVEYDIPDPVIAALDLTGDVPSEIDELVHKGFDRICSLAAKSA